LLAICLSSNSSFCFINPFPLAPSSRSSLVWVSRSRRPSTLCHYMHILLSVSYPKSFRLHVTTYISSDLGIHVLPIELFHTSRSPSSLSPRFAHLFFFSLLHCVISNVHFFCLFLTLSRNMLCYQPVCDFLLLFLFGLLFSSTSRIRLSARPNPWLFSCLLRQPTPMLIEYLDSDFC
jgi:hypothetical protein